MSAALRLSCVLAALTLAACHQPQAAPATAPAVVFDHPLPVAASGTDAYPAAVRARVEADLSFRIAGKIASRAVAAGSHVVAGQTLATLDPQDAHLNVEAARTSLAAAQADYDWAHAELTRYQDLQSKGFVSQSFVESRENAQKVSAARLAEAQARLNLIENQSGYTTLRADAPGVITTVFTEAGQVVAAGTPVMRFVADGEREAVINVPENRYEALKAAPALHITLWSKPGKTYTGRVREISPQADPGTRTHEARVTIVDADADVQLGGTATVFLGDAASTSMFRLPLSALAADNHDAAVWRIENDQVERVPVQVASYLPDAVVVTAALQPGDRIVSAGVHLLQPGQAVRPVARTRAESSP
jgi:multidrug efflux system membrane fusion protein